MTQSIEKSKSKLKHLWLTLQEIQTFFYYSILLFFGGWWNTFPGNSGCKPERDKGLAVLYWHLEAAVGILQDLLLYSLATTRFS